METKYKAAQISFHIISSETGKARATYIMGQCFDKKNFFKNIKSSKVLGEMFKFIIVTLKTTSANTLKNYKAVII